MQKIFYGSVLFILSFFTQQTSGQTSIYWDKSLGGSDNDLGFDIVPAGENYIIVGTTDSEDDDITSTHGQQDVWIVEMNAAGEIVWQKTYGGSLNDYAKSIVAANDGSGYVIAGSTFSTDGDVSGNNGDKDAWVFKINGDGDLLWQNTLGGDSAELLNDIIATSDGGYLCTGNATSDNDDLTSNYGINDLWVIKVTGTGSLEWQKNYGGTMGDFGFGAIEIADGYVVTGYSYSNDTDVSGHHGDATTADYIVFKTDADGAVTWQKSLGGDLTDYATGIILTEDEKYLVYGGSYSDDGDLGGHYGTTDYTDIWLVALNEDGSIHEENHFGGSFSDEVNSIEIDEDGGYILAGNSGSSDFDASGHHGSSSSPDVYILKLNSAFDFKWSKSCGGVNDDVGRAIYSYGTNYYISVNYTKSISGDVSGHHGFGVNNDFWIMNLTPCQPEIITDPSDASGCSGSALDLSFVSNFGLYTYTWVFTSGATLSSTSPELTIDPLTAGYAGDYYVIVEGECGSDTSATALISVTAFVTPVIDPAGPVDLCESGDVLLSSSVTDPDYVYQWYVDGLAISGATSTAYTAASAGLYTLIVSNDDGCTSTSAAVSITASLSDVTIVPVGSTNLCGGGTVTLTVTAGVGYTYQWFKDGSLVTGAITSTLLVSEPGSYTIEIISGLCDITSGALTVTSSAPEALVTAGGSLDICLTGSVTLNNATTGSGYAFQWIKDGIAISGATGTSIIATDTGFYQLYITTISGCSDTSEALKVFNSCVGIYEPVVFGNIEIFPNPGNGQFTIAISNYISLEQMEVEVYNATGQFLFKEFLPAGKNIITAKIDMAGFASGLYRIKIIQGNNFMNKTFINVQ